VHGAGAAMRANEPSNRLPSAPSPKRFAVRHDHDWYAYPYGNPCTDCASLTAASIRELRGGGFTEVSNLRGASRDVVTPVFRFLVIGLRCGRTP
jgi:hypothetical protein